MTDQINPIVPAFYEVRCEVCRHLIVEISKTTNGLIRSKCKRCTTLSLIACHSTNVPQIVDVQHKAFVAK